MRSRLPPCRRRSVRRAEAADGSVCLATGRPEAPETTPKMTGRDELREGHMRRVREPAPSRRGLAYVLGRLTLLVAALCLVSCADPLGGAPVGQPTVTALVPATATPTPLSPTEALQTEIATGATLHGHIWGMDLIPLADGTQFTIRDALTTSSLVDVQSDAYQMFKAIWTGAKYQIPSDWKIHLVFAVGATDQGPGTPIAVANLTYQTAQGFPWAQLSPAQAWRRYDGTLYNPSGVS